MGKKKHSSAKNKQKSVIFPLFIFLGIVILIGFFVMRQKGTDTTVTPREELPSERYTLDQETKEKMNTTLPSSIDRIVDVATATIVITKVMAHQSAANLSDVTSGGGEDSIIATGGGAQGLAKASYINGEYRLYTVFEALPPAPEGYYYEGWIVRQDPFSIVSTGRVDTFNDEFINIFISSEDLSEYDVYVLTLEPDDDDPSPATHILEGKLSTIIRRTDR